MPGVVKELAVGGVWCASAIGVAGWTWQAYTQQYQKFPMPGDAPGGSNSGDLQTWIDLATNPIKFVGDLVAKQVDKALKKPLRTIFAPIPPKAIKAKGGPGTLGAAPGIQPHPGK